MEHDKNKRYWNYNLPLQLWPDHEDPDDDNSKVVGYSILNYMPRKERCITLKLDEDTLEEQTYEEFCTKAAEVLENLAELFRRAATNPGTIIYYPDEAATA